MYDPDANAPLVNPLPPVVVVLALVMGCAELVFQLGEAGLIGGPGAISWRGSIADTFGFSNNAAQWMWETKTFPREHLMRFVTYPFVHAGFGSALFALVFVLALGKYVGERVGTLSFLAIFFGSAIFAALVYAVLLGPRNALLGGHTAGYGLIGAFTWIMVGNLRNTGENALRAFRLIGGLAVLHLVFYLIFGGNVFLSRGAGFAGGFLICAALRPKEAQGLAFLWERMRNR